MQLEVVSTAHGKVSVPCRQPDYGLADLEVRAVTNEALLKNLMLGIRRGISLTVGLHLNDHGTCDVAHFGRRDGLDATR